MLDIVPSAMNNLFGVRTVESIVLILIGLFIFGFAFYKGYKVWDTYPGYMLKHRALRDAQKNLKDEREEISKGADTKLGTQIREFENIGSLLSAKRAQLDALWPAPGSEDTEWVSDGAGGGSWRDGSLRESSSLRPCA